MDKKQILTRELIKNDLKQLLIKEIPYSLFLTPFVLFGNFLVVTVISLFKDLTYQFKLVFSIIFYVVFFSWLIYCFFDTIIALININKFEVQNDRVIKKLPKHLGSKFRRYTPYTLIFAHSGKYCIPNQKNYKYSISFTMWDEDVYDDTNLNDEFYLISVGRRKNILAYNKKMFEYQEI